MDAASPAAACRPLIRIAGALLLFSTSFLPGMQGQEAQDSRLSQIKQLVSEQRWQEAVALAESAPARSPDLDFYYGTALARLGRWDDAHRIFKAGYRLSPSDERFAVELAGVEFKQKRYAAAAAHLRRALKLVPGDTYANDFLASVYLLEGSQEAALQRWNREKKPRIAAVTPEPVPQIDPALLDRAFAFSPAATLLLPQLLASEKRVQGLDIFSAYRFDLSARPDGAFDMLFYNKERNGWGNGKLGVLVQLFH
ncbi:MAG TPA: tetratricopeptide repeat protein, partial [Terriglobales bacterium]|nr:tetratricopeptide repeat protein [Terriglobales bacterium]